MLILFILIVGAFLLAPQICVCFITNLWHSVTYLVKDIVDYVKYKKGRLVKTGELVGFIGLFGKGKTLSAVHKVRSIYRAHNGQLVYCPRRKKWVTQKVDVISNVKLKDVPFTPLESLQQVVDCTENIKAIDDKNDTLTVTLVLIDEAGSELNSRTFKSNIDPLVLNSILTCRHYNLLIYYTAQRFGHVDALLRQVTSYVYACDKRWRFQFQRKFDAWTLEQAQNPSLVPCESILSWFIKDSDFNAYDTFDTVEKLKKDVKEGQMMSEEEILSLRGLDSVGNISDLNGAVKKSRRKRYLF